jgi:hypothetical protein
MSSHSFRPRSLPTGRLRASKRVGVTPRQGTAQTPVRSRFVASPDSSVSGPASAGRHGQRPDPLEHRPEQPPRQMALRQQEPVVPGVLDQPSTRFDEALLEAGQ